MVSLAVGAGIFPFLMTSGSDVVLYIMGLSVVCYGLKQFID